jgi:GTP-binding protein
MRKPAPAPSVVDSPTNTPSVAIVGRPNVGKSALFNRLARRRISIVHDQPGVTRDRLHAICSLGERPFQIVDTGGIGGGVDDGFENAVEREVEIAMEIADVIVLVVDAQSGVTPIDSALAKRLRRTAKPIVLVVNKVDHEKHEDRPIEFERLGFGTPLQVSAAHGRGIGTLVERIEELFPAHDADESASDDVGATDKALVGKRVLRVALAGRPNVGKSSLLNAIVGSPRAIVSDIPGTTRDSVDTLVNYGGRDFVIIDTAGLRHQRKHNSSVEVFSAMRSRENIENADLVILLIDATAGVTSQDKQIAGILQEARRPCIIVGSKWDLIKPDRAPRDKLNEWLDETRREMFFLDFAPIILLSSITGENVPLVFKAIQRVETASAARIGTGILNRLVEDIQTRNPPPASGSRRLKILYATSTESGRSQGSIPLPTFVLFTNDPTLMTPAYLKHFERRIRKAEPFEGLPLVFQLRGRAPREARDGQPAPDTAPKKRTQPRRPREAKSPGRGRTRS